MALALLLAVLLLPLGARAQGLHSASATVTLMAVKSEPQMVVRDWALPLHEDGGLVVAVRLPDESAAQPLYVRNRFGRLERLGAGWTAVQPGTLRFRVVRPAGGPELGWRMGVSMRDTVTGATRESVVFVSAR